jgi:hypothetical protein
MPLEMTVQDGKVKIKTPEGDTVERPVADFVRDNPELAGRIKSSRIMARLAASKIVVGASLGHPSELGEIEVGDLVMVRATRQFGSVIRTLGDALRVEASDGSVNTFWRQELDRRKA